VAGNTDILTGPLTVSGVAITPIDDSLNAVVAAVNAKSDLGVRAAALQTAPGQYRLQLTATSSGAGSVTVAGVDTATLGQSSVAGQDAEISIGPRDPEDVITSKTNTFTGVLPGLSFTVKAPATGVTIDLSADGDAVANKVQAMVDAANAALDEIAKLSKVDPKTRTSGPLATDSAIRSLQQQVLSTVNTAVSGVGIAKDAGIELTKDGYLTFSKDTFLTAFSNDRDTLQRLLGPSGTFAPATSGLLGSVSLIGSTDRTQEGSYAVSITQAATRASGTVTMAAFQDGDTIRVSNPSGSVTAEYAVPATDTLADVVNGLNAAIRDKGLAVSAAADGPSGIRLDATIYGSAGTFALTATGAASASAVTAGLDVAGTIDGQASTGSGQTLSVNSAVTGAATSGLSVQVTLTPADLTTIGGPAVGTFAYIKGVAQRLSALSETASDSVDGFLTTAVSERTNRIDELNDQISEWDVRLDIRRKSLQRQFANLEVTLGKLRDQSSWLAGQLASLPTAS
jgi:flagellar hook-associated protein 2